MMNQGELTEKEKWVIDVVRNASEYATITFYKQRGEVERAEVKESYKPLSTETSMV